MTLTLLQGYKDYYIDNVQTRRICKKIDRKSLSFMGTRINYSYFYFLSL